MGLFDRFKRPAHRPGADPRLEQLVQQLTDADWAVRRDAARALGELGASARVAVPALEQAISDENGEVCLAASDALSRIRIACD